MRCLSSAYLAVSEGPAFTLLFTVAVPYLLNEDTLLRYGKLLPVVLPVSLPFLLGTEVIAPPTAGQTALASELRNQISTPTPLHALSLYSG